MSVELSKSLTTSNKNLRISASLLKIVFACTRSEGATIGSGVSVGGRISGVNVTVGGMSVWVGIAVMSSSDEQDTKTTARHIMTVVLVIL
jgi:hypothetical protein